MYFPGKLVPELRKKSESKATNEGRGMDWWHGIGMCTLLYEEWMVNRDHLCITGNSAQYSVLVYMGREGMCVPVSRNHLGVQHK